MRILFLSGREKEYSRNASLLAAMKKEHHVTTCTTSFKNYLLRIFTTYFVFLFHQIFRRHDIIFIGFFGQPFVPFVRLFSRKPIVFDAFLCGFETLVHDRKRFSERSLRGRLFWHLDKIACQAADKVLLDTQQHINYFVKEFSLPPEKFTMIPIGANEKIFFPRESPRKDNEFIVEFHGTFVPLQGTSTIIKAAALLKSYSDIRFCIIGEGQDFASCQKLAEQHKLSNISFLRRIPLNAIAKSVRDCDIGLGIFGKTAKCRRVIPNKLYELIAMKRAVITSDTPAVREIFSDKKDIFFCKQGDERSLADAILALKKDGALRLSLARNARKTFEKECSAHVISKKLSSVFEKVSA